jgi:WD40 repeat protein
MRRTLFQILAVAVLCAASGCTNDTTVAAKPAGGDADPANAANAEIGGPLFPPAPFPQPPARAEAAADPILVSANVNVVDKVDIPTQRDGKILFIGTEYKPGEVVMDSSKLYRHRDKVYRPLEPGNRVEKGQLVMILDDAEANAELELRRAASVSSEAIHQKSQEVLNATIDIYKAKKKLNEEKGLSYLELVTSYIEMKRAEATVADSNASMLKSIEELKKAQVNYDMYYLKSSVAGVVQPFNRKQGESIKALEAALQIQSVDRLRAEGLVSVGFVGRLAQDMPVTIEPTLPVGENVRRRFHTQGVNGVAVSSQAKPLIVSASDDKTACVWDGRSQFVLAKFTHPAAVRSVVCSPKGAAKQYCLTGAEDGKARLWDLNNPQNGNTPLRELEGFAHKFVITALAFSPDGKLCATADSRDIALWDAESGKLKYRLPQVHLGDIQSVAITPQAKLVSASRDLTVRVWSLGESGAKLDFTQDGRTGDVGRLGVSSDGRYFLFDIAQTLQLMSIQDRRSEGWLETSSDSNKFATFAIFSHDNKTILTGSQGDGRLSVWRTPSAGNRPTELRQFVPSQKLVTFTCGAISTTETEPFAVTGSKSGEIYVWPMPTEKDMLKIKGILTFIDQNTTASQQVRVWAEFDNRAAELRPGGAVTIVIEPTQK